MGSLCYPGTEYTVEMDLTTADLAVKVAIEKAEEIGGKFSIAVLDAGVDLVAFSRMDGGRVGTIDVAMKKARTSALFELDCGELGSRTQPGQAVYGLEHSNGGLITFPGGVALRSKAGQFIGSIGVSGGTVEADLDIAKAAAAAVAAL